MVNEGLIPGQFDVSFKVLAEMSPAGIHITDETGKCVYANPAWCRMAGLTCEEATGDGWIKAIHPEDRSRIFSDWGSFMKGEIQWESEYRFVDIAGKITWVYGAATLLKGKTGLVENVIGITINITERKKYERELKESEERFRMASEATGFGTFSYDFESGKAYYSGELLNLYGLTPGETLELDRDLVVKVLHPDDKKRFLAAMLEANDPGGSGILDIEFRIIRKDGDEHWLRTRGLTTFTSNKFTLRPLRATGIVQDITERKNSELFLRQAHEWQKSIFEGSLDAIFISDENSVLIAVNKAACDLTGYPRDQLLKMRIPDLHDEPDLEAYRKYHKRIFKGEKILSEAKIHRSDGVKVDTEFNNSRISISDKLYMHTTARDITDRKKIELELRKSKELLEKLNQHLIEVRENERNQIALNLHDDLGQKLTAINLDIAWLKSRIGVQSKTVREKFEEMSGMIKETIESIKETSSFLRPAILFDLGLVPAIKSQLNNFEKQSGIKCHFCCDPEEELPNERISLILYRILQESLTNISRHSEATEMELELLILKSKVEMLIKDNGIGIRKELVNSLNSMGIAGMKERIKSVSGKITIRGEKGSGTRIKIFIPLNKG